MQVNEDRIYDKDYYLDEYNKSENPCLLCELSNECDNIADELNCISYCICLNSIKDKTYKKEHPYSYFKKIVKFK